MTDFIQLGDVQLECPSINWHARNRDRLRRHVVGLLEVDEANKYRFEFVADRWLSGIVPQTIWHVPDRR